MCRIRDKMIRGAFSMYTDPPFPNSDVTPASILGIANRKMTVGGPIPQVCCGQTGFKIVD